MQECQWLGAVVETVAVEWAPVGAAGGVTAEAERELQESWLGRVQSSPTPSRPSARGFIVQLSATTVHLQNPSTTCQALQLFLILALF